VILAGGVLFAAWSFPLFLLIDTQNTGLIVIAMSVATILGGMLYGPLASLMSELFATRFRYSGASMGYQLGQTLGGGFSPLIATGLFAATGGSWSVSLYLVGAGLLAAACTWFLSETKAKDLTA
jgi:dipeptide/tripeptide permease